MSRDGLEILQFVERDCVPEVGVAWMERNQEQPRDLDRFLHAGFAEKGILPKLHKRFNQKTASKDAGIPLKAPHKNRKHHFQTKPKSTRAPILLKKLPLS